MNNKGSGGDYQAEHAWQHPLLSEEEQASARTPEDG